MQNLAKQIKVVTLTVDGTNYTGAAGTSALTSNSIDTLGFRGLAIILNIGTVTSTGTDVIKLQYSDDDSTYADVTGATTATLTDKSNKNVLLEIYRPAHRYYKVVSTRGTANSVINSLTAILYDPIKADVTADTTNTSTVAVVGG